MGNLVIQVPLKNIKTKPAKQEVSSKLDDLEYHIKRDVEIILKNAMKMIKESIEASIMNAHRKI